MCGQFVELCRRLKLFTRAIVAIDGSKFKAVNNRDKNFTVAKVGKRMEQVDAMLGRKAPTASHFWRLAEIESCPRNVLSWYFLALKPCCAVKGHSLAMNKG